MSGVVTDGSGTPLAGINVNANPFNGPGPSAGAQTAADGTYRTGPLPDGAYRVQFSDPDNVWAIQYWPAANTFNTAGPVELSVAAGNEHGGVDASLTAAATITGVVTDAAGAPLADICVNGNTPEQGGFSGLGSSARTAADGTYSLSGTAGRQSTCASSSMTARRSRRTSTSGTTASPTPTPRRRWCWRRARCARASTPGCRTGSASPARSPTRRETRWPAST